jgi:hypothetical protein
MAFARMAKFLNSRTGPPHLLYFIPATVAAFDSWKDDPSAAVMDYEWPDAILFT